MSLCKRLEMAKDLIKQVNDPRFSGLIVFGNAQECERFLIDLVVPFRLLDAKYNKVQNVITFPSGARVTLIVVTDPQFMVQRLCGQVFTEWEYASTFANMNTPESVEEFIKTRIRV